MDSQLRLVTSSSEVAVRPTVIVTTERVTLPTFLAAETPMHTLPGYYSEALGRAGVDFLMVGRMEPGRAGAILDAADGLVVIGGGDIDPARYGQPNTHSFGIDEAADARDIELIHEAHRRSMPVLGICRGLQVLCVACGGSLRQEVNGRSNAHPALADDAAERNMHSHVVAFAANSRLAGLYGTAERKVNSLHHQAVTSPGDGLEIVAESEDGLIEAVESSDPSWPVLAVQWHPEMMDDPAEDVLFAAFVADAMDFRTRRLAD